MKDEEMKRPIEWARRVNRRWIVHHGLGNRAEEWLAHLETTDAPRLKKSCEIARAMIHRWGDQAGDPKPWFYAGLFSTATADEVRKFLAGHRLTTAAVPAMAADEAVQAWDDALCSDTRDLLERLKAALAEVRGSRRAGRSGA